MHVKQPTVPLFLKRLVNPNVSESSVTCSENECRKTFSNEEAYTRELGVYQRNLDYVPTLLSYDPSTLSITTKRVGRSIGTIWTSVPVLGPVIGLTIFYRLRHRIKTLHRLFHYDTGLYHNDLAYKNVLMDEKDKLYLIDFEITEQINRDADIDGILSNGKGIRSLFVVVTFVVMVLLLRRLSGIFSRSLTSLKKKGR